MHPTGNQMRQATTKARRMGLAKRIPPSAAPMAGYHLPYPSRLVNRHGVAPCAHDARQMGPLGCGEQAAESPKDAPQDAGQFAAGT